ncbi:hypothetical protein T492DRAFT_893361 [Pavlovales sp. CCMP2436]|nr:hypothetical protein T492DRAFT_893361 [Pavlovales sp. CCMP2436]
MGRLERECEGLDMRLREAEEARDLAHDLRSDKEELARRVSEQKQCTPSPVA